MHRFEAKQFIPTTLETAWDFISSPVNLKKITPPYMGFDIMNTPPSEKMYPGMIIVYRVSPLFGIPMQWVTEITHVVDLHYFVDEQRIGPYSLWHHEHFLLGVKGGVEMIDILHYKVPFGLFGRILNKLVIRKKIEEIFSFRYKAVEKLFKV